LKEEALDRLFGELAVEEAKELSYGRQWNEWTITRDLPFFAVYKTSTPCNFSHVTSTTLKSVMSL